MARPRKRRTRGRKRQPRPPHRTGAALVDDVVQDTAATFTCSTKILSDFLYQCESRIEEVEGELRFNLVAVEMWRDHSDPLAQILHDFAAERTRHLSALDDIRCRLTALTPEPSLDHLHLDPVEPYRALIRSRIFGNQPD